MDTPEPEQARRGPRTSIRPLQRMDLETALALKVAPEQQKWIPENVYSLAQSKFEPCTPYGIFYGEELVGLLMICFWNGLHWINRIMVDANWQDRGLGGKALELALETIRQQAKAREVRTSVARDNAVAEYLFHRLGFRRMDNMETTEGEADPEFVMQLFI